MAQLGVNNHLQAKRLQHCQKCKVFHTSRFLHKQYATLSAFAVIPHGEEHQKIPFAFMRPLVALKPKNAESVESIK